MSTFLRPQPFDFDDLAPRDAALLSVVRAIAIGRGECPLLRSMLAPYAEDVDAAFAHALAFVRLIGWRGTRRIRLHAPGSRGVSDDEILILAATDPAVGPGSDWREALVAELMGGAFDRCVAAAAFGVARACSGDEPEGPVRAQPALGLAHA